MPNKLVDALNSGATPGLNDFIEQWGDLFPLMYEMKKTEQDSVWHGEGNVYIHTQMVLDEIYRWLADDGKDVTAEQRTTLILGAVFHDIAKSLVSAPQMRHGRMRIVSPKHGDRGRSYLALKLPQLPLPRTVIRGVLGIVGLHHDPKLLVIRNKDVRQYRALARLADLKTLYQFELADMRGRICPDLSDQLEHLSMFRMFAEDWGLWENANPYQEWQTHIDEAMADFPADTRALVYANAVQDYEAGIIYQPEEAIARSYQYRDSHPQLVMVCGPAGSGKSTWIKKHLQDHQIISLDDIRLKLTGRRNDQSKNGEVLQEAKKQLRQGLREHRKIVWDATNIRRDLRRPIIQLGVDYHALVTLVVFQTPESELITRNRQREHPLPMAALQRQLDRLEWPYANEAHRLLFAEEYE